MSPQDLGKWIGMIICIWVAFFVLMILSGLVFKYVVRPLFGAP